MHKKYELIVYKAFFGFKLIVFMAMFVYKYVFNKHVIGWWWGGDEARIQIFIIEGRPVLARGQRTPFVQGSAQGGKGKD